MSPFYMATRTGRGGFNAPLISYGHSNDWDGYLEDDEDSRLSTLEEEVAKLRMMVKTLMMVSM